MNQEGRKNGTILFYVAAPDDQQKWFYQQRRADGADWRQLSQLQGMLQGDDGWVYGWREGHSYRDFTTPDKLQAGCRVSFAVDEQDKSLATGLSWHPVPPL